MSTAVTASPTSTPPALPRDARHPATPHPTVATLQRVRAMCRDLMGGTDAIHAKYKAYLPQHALEDDASYKKRAHITEVFDGFERSVKASAGLLTARPIAIGADVPDVIRRHLEAIDDRRRHVDVFARDVVEDALTAGFGGILVDAPPAPAARGGTLSLREEDDLGIRPYWAWYAAEDVVSWRTVREGAQTLLRQLVLAEAAEVDDGDYGERTEQRWRVLRRERRAPTAEAHANGVLVGEPVVTWRLLAEAMQDGASALVERGAGTMTNHPEIPFAPLVAGTARSWWHVQPPLLPIANLTLAHWRVATDRRWNLHMSLVPVAVRIGWIDRQGATAERAQLLALGHEPKGEPLAIGPNACIDLPAGGDFKYVVAPSEATTHAMAELDAIERRAGSTILGFWIRPQGEQETATAKRIDTAPRNASLNAVGRAVQDCFEQALIFHARFLGHLVADWRPASRTAEGREGGSLTLNSDFDGTVISPELLKVLNDMAAVNNLPLRVLFLLMERGRLLPEGESVDALVREVMRQHDDQLKRETALGQSAWDSLIAGQGADGADAGGTGDAAPTREATGRPTPAEVARA